MRELRQLLVQVGQARLELLRRLALRLPIPLCGLRFVRSSLSICSTFRCAAALTASSSFCRSASRCTTASVVSEGAASLDAAPATTSALVVATPLSTREVVPTIDSAGSGAIRVVRRVVYAAAAARAAPSVARI